MQKAKSTPNVATSEQKDVQQRMKNVLSIVRYFI